MTAKITPAAADAQVSPLPGASGIPPAQWDGLARRGFHLHDWFLPAERSGWRPRHVALSEMDELRAVVPAYLTGRDSLHDLHDRWLGPIGDIATLSGVHLRPMISVQTPLAMVSEPMGVPEAMSHRALHQIFEALEERAEADGAKGVVWPCVDAGTRTLLQVGKERGYAAEYAGASARLTVEWGSFEDYLASRSKNVRRTVKADLGALRSAGLRMEVTSDFRHAVPAMAALQCEAYRRRNQRESPVQESFFHQLSLNPSARIRAQLTWSGERLVGASLNLMTPEVLEGTLGAFAPEHRRGPAYHNDLCYEPIRMACREGIAAIDLGATALYSKVLRGAVLRPRFTLIRGTTRARHLLLSSLARLVAWRTEWKEQRSLGPFWHPGLRGSFASCSP